MQALALTLSLGSMAIVLQAPPASAAISVASDAGSWGVNGRIRAMVRVGDTVYLGGKFTQAVSPDGSTTVPRHNLAAIDVTNGQLLPWAPLAENPGGTGKAAAGAVFGMETDGSQVFIAGDFTTITWTAPDGVTTTTTPRARFASLAPDQYGSLLGLTANSDLRQRALALSGTTLYIGGEFAHMDGLPRTRLAAIDITNGQLLSWNPSANAAVVSMGAPSTGNIMIAGSFMAVNGDTTQTFLAALDPSGGLVSWNVHPVSKVLSLVVHGANTYTGLGGSGNAVQAFDAVGNSLWMRGTNGDVQAVGFCQGQVIAGGHFGKIGPNRIAKLAALDPVTGKVDTTWDPHPAGGTFGVWSLLGTTNKLFAGGDFSSVGGQAADHYAQFSTGPAIIGFSPTSGTEGTTVQISGKTLTDTTAVDFNGTPTPFTVEADTLITTTVPVGATTGTVHVTTPDGTATSAQVFTVLPTLTGMSPTSGPVGADVTITGTHLAGTTKVKFGGIPAVTFTVDSNTQVTAQVPPSAVTGVVVVTTPDGDATSSGAFTVTPTITSFSPKSGKVGDSVTITGTTLLGTSSVSFNGVAASSFVVNSRTQVVAVVAAGTTTGTISLTTPDGTAVSATSFKVLPSITGFTPSSGPVGTTVTISGYNLTGATKVKFAGTNAVFTVDTDQQITATVPVGAVSGTITVVTPTASVTSADTFTVT